MPLFRSQLEKWAMPIVHARLRRYPGLPSLESSRALFETVLPRGVLLARETADRERMNYFMSPGALTGCYRYQPGGLVIGKLGSTPLGYHDDRAMIVAAGARSGKSSTVLVPNLYTYPGSMLVLDPKGELARLTARHRRALGHTTVVVDAFGQSGEESACFNCLEELNAGDDAVIDHVVSMVYALVPDSDGGGNAKFFNDSARTLLVGIILYVLALKDDSKRNLVTVRQLVTLSYPPLIQAAKARAEWLKAQARENGKTIHVDPNSIALKVLFEMMIDVGDKWEGIAASIGHRFLNTPPVELGGVMSTASVNTDFIDSLLLRKIIRRSDFKLSDLRGERPTTIYLVLPVSELARHSRFLRLIVQLACTKLERLGTYPRDMPRILFMLEEFSVLGHLRTMEDAMAYMPGFGVQMLIAIQSLQQLITHYPKSYQTFLGNAGLIQMFAADGPALDYAASRMGKMMETFELRQAFSRGNNSQLLLFEGEPPAAATRLSHDDVAWIRQQAASPRLSPPFNAR